MNTAHWIRYRQQRQGDPAAAERGRLLTAQAMSVDADGLKRMEDRFGVEFCRRNYPEAYASGVSKFLDNLRSKLPW